MFIQTKVLVGLIFLRYVSTAFEKRYQELIAEGEGFEDDRDAYSEKNVFIFLLNLDGQQYQQRHINLKLVR